jgi:hypothetical protein
VKLIYIPFSSGGGISFTKVDNFSDLPEASNNPDELFYVRNNQGTKWLPGSFGGTYYPKGWYLSTGTTWEHTEMPWQATQADVIEGFINDQFVSPSTLAGWWTNIKTLAQTFTGIITFHIVRFIPVIANFSGTYTSNLATSNLFILTQTGNGTLDYSNAGYGSYTWIINTGGFTLSFAAGKFQAEGVPTIAGKVLISGIYDGSRMIITNLKNLADL